MEASLGIQEYLYESSYLASGVNIHSCIFHKERPKANDGSEKFVNFTSGKKDESISYIIRLC
jgi:hypothetical protein